MILVDSSVWIDFFRGTATPEAERLDSLLGSELLAVGDLILAEVLQGFGSERDASKGIIRLYSGRDFDPFIEHLGLRSAMAEN